MGNRPPYDNSHPPLDDFTSGTGVFLWPNGYVLDDCFAYYVNLAEEGSDPIVGYVDTGC